MYLNLAAAWKALDLEGDLTEENIKLVRRGFYCGAHAAFCAQANIIETHEGEAATILLKAMWAEVKDFAHSEFEVDEADA